MLKFSRGKLIVFDIEEALSFEGETGPYLQYAVVRANNIFHKLQEREGLTEADVLAALDDAAPDELDRRGDDAITTCGRSCFEAARLDDVVEQVVRSLEFSVLAKYAFGLAQLFNAFYHRYPILNEEQADRKRWRAAGVAYVRDAADARARSDGDRSSEPDVDHDLWPSLASRRAGSSKTTGRRSSTSAARSRILDPSMPVDEALDGVDGLLLTGGDDVAPARYGEARASDGRRSRAGARRVRDRADRRGARARAADLRHLPRRAGAERRLRRHARAGHPVAGARRARAQPGRAAASVVRARARGLGREGLAAGDADARAAERRRRLRGEQPPSSGGQGRSRRASACRRRRRTASSKRSRIRRRASASASSGTRRISGAPASSGRCSKGSSRRRRRRRRPLRRLTSALHSRLEHAPPSRRAACSETDRTRRRASSA